MKRTKKATQIARQQTLLRDRHRTRAVLLYLADHRQRLTKMLPRKIKKDKSKIRSELLRMARKRFNQASQGEKQTYHDRAKSASRSAGEVGEQPPRSIEQPLSKLVEPRSIGEEQLVEFRSSVEFRSAGDGKAGSPPRTPPRGVISSSALHAAVGHPTPRKVAGRSFRSAPAAPWSPSQSSGPACPLRDSLMREIKLFRDLYGDAGALETMACAIRILDVVDMKRWRNRRAVKLAVVAGMAAKLVPTSSDEKHVRTLWAKFAGESALTEVRKLEREVFMAWAKS